MLFEPLVTASLQLAIRVVMAPMTRSRAVDANTPSALMAEYYGQRASAGLIIAEGTSPSPNGLGYARIPMGLEQVDLFGFSMGGMIAQEIVLMEPKLVRRMIITGTGPAGGEGISKVARMTYFDMFRGLLTCQDPKQFLFFARTPAGIRAGKGFLQRLKERSENRDKEAAVAVLQAQLKALRRWDAKKPANLSEVPHPVLVANGASDRMVPSKNTRDLAQRLSNSELIIYPDSGHGAVFQFHADFVQRALAFVSR
ncbi:MAG: alpha/beta fold hydrolase [Proteobacteria bacterium]|nr:alpha/beta fold hydrolase [Pseudomonadota bacterium]